MRSIHAIQTIHTHSQQKLESVVFGPYSRFWLNCHPGNSVHAIHPCNPYNPYTLAAKIKEVLFLSPIDVCWVHHMMVGMPSGASNARLPSMTRAWYPMGKVRIGSSAREQVPCPWRFLFSLCLQAIGSKEMRLIHSLNKP